MLSKMNFRISSISRQAFNKQLVILRKNTKYNSFPLKLVSTPSYSFSKKRAKELLDDLHMKKSNSLSADDFDTFKETGREEDIVPTEMKDYGNLKPEAKKEEEVPEKREIVTTKILCDIIGTKHYPCNEEIGIAKGAVVSVYDENDKLLGNMFFSQAIKNAEGLDKDIVLRNDKVSPPIVKMMKYRVELVKRLFKKLGKNLGKDVSDENLKYKVFGFGLKTEIKDFESKIDKLRALLAEYNYVKVVIPIDLDSNQEIIKSTQILKNIQESLTSHAKLRAGPIKQKKKKDKIKSLDPSLSATADEIQYADKEISTAMEAAASNIQNEKDLDYIDSMYIELESLTVDRIGIDYEQLLKTTDFTTLVRGVTHSNLISDIQEAKMGGSSTSKLQERITEKISHYSKGLSTNTSIKQQLKMLEREIVVQNDISKRIKIQAKIESMKSDLRFTNMTYTARIVKNRMTFLLKKSAKKEGLLDRNKS